MKYKPILEEKDIECIEHLSEIDCPTDCDDCPLLTRKDDNPCIRDIAIHLVDELRKSKERCEV